MKTLQYYSADSTHTVFSKYTISTSGIIQNKKSMKPFSYRINDGYYIVSVQDDVGKPWTISVARAVASTFLGKPPTIHHTADHIISDEKLNNDVSNIRWASKSDQNANQNRRDTLKSAFVIVKDDMEMTVKEWVAHLIGIKNPFGRDYTASMVNQYASKKQHGFSYKEFVDLPGEVWKYVKDSESPRGDRWEISNMNRVKYITKYANNILSGDNLCLLVGYPVVCINGKKRLCHIIAFDAFHPDVARDGLVVRHKNDDRLNFQPENLILGTMSDNSKDAYDNGKYDGTKSARVKCASFIDGILEKDFSSLSDATKYLKTKGYTNAKVTGVSRVLTGERNTAYGRVWKNI
ncbi:hypothetical protein PBCVOR070422_206R [Paramecium bursaria Chlorella virus OR0704.2.2]|nr:hypothetical protein PBCVOR070422_206R [Paramecium bursaria Chlorella virus OR0704.2.2]